MSPKQPRKDAESDSTGTGRTTTSPRAATGGRPRIRVSHGTKTTDARPQPPPKGIAEHSPSVPPQPLPRPKRGRKYSKGSTNAVQTALAIAEAALDKKAANVEIIDLEGKADYTDFLVLMSGGSDRHVRALADAIQEHLREKIRVRALSVEGTGGGTWVLIDYGDVVVHVFQESTRALYDLDGLWLDAARVPVPED